MVESVLNAVSVLSSANYTLPHVVIVLVSFWMFFPLVLGEFLRKLFLIPYSLCSVFPIFKGSCFQVLLKTLGHHVQNI